MVLAYCIDLIKDALRIIGVGFFEQALMMPKGYKHAIFGATIGCNKLMQYSSAKAPITWSE